jgi:SAM-dependent methyltransferase
MPIGESSGLALYRPRSLSSAGCHVQSYLRELQPKRKLGRHRSFLLDLLKSHSDLFGCSILDIGAGTPDFLSQLDWKKRVALDNDSMYAQQFLENGVAFINRDLDKDSIDDLGLFDVIVCSDVFEHLLDPRKILVNLAELLGPRGVLLSHVPNEFTVEGLIKIVFDRSESVQFHSKSDEWSDPHLRRFTAKGYRRFLGLEFRHNLRLNALYPIGKEKRFLRWGRMAPLGWSAGPTFLSTNDAAIASAFKERYPELLRFM